MIKRILIIALIVIGLGIVGVGGYLVYHQFIAKEADTSQQAETEIPIQQGLGEIPEAPGGEAEFGGLPDAEPGSDRALEPGEAEPLPEGEVASEEGVLPGEGELQPGDLAGDVTGPVVPGEVVETEPVLPGEREPRPASETTGARPGTTGATEPSEFVADVAEEQPTLSPPETTITPVPEATSPPQTPTPAPAPGTYSVRTLVPVFESQLGDVRKAMNRLGVKLKEQKTGQRHIQAYRLAVGYFRTKAEAESWAQYNFKPKGVAYYVYAAQNMYSIQVGVYSQPQNVEVAMRQLYQKFPGWRLPIRREVATITKATYSLSVTRISHALADKIWRELNRLGVQAEISGV
jgi:hypothetical protein